jgi:cation diffusion facilitator CzcD-associated flavoprotein CzcO
MFHTARYQEDYDLTGKRVAVIGSGSSGVQVVASIYPQVSKLYTWVRSPTWITAGFAQKYAGKGGANFACKLDDLMSVGSFSLTYKQTAKKTRRSGARIRKSIGSIERWWKAS